MEMNLDIYKDAIEKYIVKVLVCCAFIFNFFIFAPIELYYTNIMDFWFKPVQFIPILIFFTIIVFTVLILFTWKQTAKNKKIINIIFAINLCLYIQGNFLNIGYSKLDGSEIQWNKLIVKGIINTIIWVIIFSISLYSGKKRKIIFQCVVSFMIIAIEATTLYVLIPRINDGLANFSLSNKNYYLDETNIFKLSKNENLIIFVADTFEGKYMSEVIEKYPEVKEWLKDFIYFDNTTSPATQTFTSMPIIFTGEENQVGLSLAENINVNFTKTNMYDILADKKYVTEIYTEPALIPGIDKNIISNRVKVEKNVPVIAQIQILKELYGIVMYRYMPHFLKCYFYDNTDIQNNIALNVDKYNIDDVIFNYFLTGEKKITTEADYNTFKIYHLNGIHVPYIVNENVCYYADAEEYIKKVPEDERRMTQAYATLKILRNYIEQLKENNIYDNTNIIFISDHGWQNRYHSTLLMKKKGADAEFNISHAPISLLEDLKPTILNLVTESKEYGKDIFDYSENEERTRRVLNYAFTRADNTYTILSKLTIETNGNAADIDSYKIVNEEYYNKNDIKKKYSFGKEINFIKEKNLSMVKTVGILTEKIRTVSKGYTMSDKAIITLHPQASKTDVIANIKLKDVFYRNQNLIFYVNDNKVCEKEVQVDSKNELINFTIPKEIWNSNDELVLKIELPDAVLGAVSILGQEILYMGVWIDSIVFNN